MYLLKAKNFSIQLRQFGNNLSGTGAHPTMHECWDLLTG